MSAAPTLPDTVQADSFLTLHYRIALDHAHENGDIVNTFADKPATLQLGQSQMAPALEQCLLGLTTGQRKIFQLDSAQAYGPRNPELIQKVSRATLDQNSEPDASYSPGDLVDFPAPNGGRFAGVLKEINDQYALFDFNHPLAGKAVMFEVQILGIL